ncbi:unnamed protein product [Nezara viridula]|uniref:Uncharacterized protein n=1 Tax=Nezara viridula TaxID=85310 RepID=A0A9P0H6I5_NEZVI|nr:unnamed protein product [Nezara viridula]
MHMEMHPKVRSVNNSRRGCRRLHPSAEASLMISPICGQRWLHANLYLPYEPTLGSPPRSFLLGGSQPDPKAAAA